MFRIIYFSGVTAPISDDGLIQLAARAAEKNARNGVTGLLLYCQGNFLQVIEGEEKTLRDLYDVIREDRRHRRVITVVEEMTEERDFPSWGMGFRNLDSDSNLPEGLERHIFIAWDEVTSSVHSKSVRNIIRIFSEATNTKF